jgi:hypothetical protein
MNSKNNIITIISGYQRQLKSLYSVLLVGIITLNKSLEKKVGLGKKYEEKYFEDLQTLHKAISYILQGQDIENQKDIIKALQYRYSNMGSVSKVHLRSTTSVAKSSVKGGKKSVKKVKV